MELDILPGLQRTAAEVHAKYSGDPSSVFRPMMPPKCAIGRFDKAAVSRQRKRDKTCFEKHPGVCRSLHIAIFSKIKRCHRFIIHLLVSLAGTTRRNIGATVFSVVLNGSEITEDNMFECDSRYFIWSDYHGVCRRGSPTGMRLVRILGNGTALPALLCLDIQDGRMTHTA